MRRKPVDIGADRGMRAYVTGGASNDARRVQRRVRATACRHDARRARWLASRTRRQTLRMTHRSWAAISGQLA